MMCPTFFLSICMILGEIILDMFSARTRYIAARTAIRYKKDGILTKSVFFDANNQRLFASLFDGNGNCNVVKNQIALDEFHLIQLINRGATVLQI